MDETSRPAVGRRTSLVPAFAALTSSQLVRTAAGFVFWVLVARMAPASAVGVAGAVIAAVTLLSRFTSLGLGTFLMAELPTLAGAGARELFRLATTVLVAVTVPVTLVYAVVVLLVVDGESSAHAAVNSLPLALLFLATMVLTAVTSVWDYGALGLGRASAQVVRNLIASFGRFPLLLAWPLLGDVGAEAILVAWVVPMGLSVVVFAAQVRLGVGRRASPARSRQLLGQHWRTSLGHYFLDVALSLGPLLVPVVAAAVLVPRDNGFFTVAWMAASVVFVAPYALSTSLFASSAADGGEAYLHRCRRVLPAGLGLVTAGVLGTWLLGPFLFHVFGEEYVDASLPLTSLLVLGGYWMVLKDLLLDWMRIEHRFATATTVAALATLLDVAGALVGGLVLGGGDGVATGWVVSSGIQVVLFSPVLLGFVRRIAGAGRIDQPRFVGLVGWGVLLVRLAAGRRARAPRLLTRPVRRLQWRYLDWPLQRLALAVLTRRRDGSWWDRLPAELVPADQPVFFGGRDEAGAALAGFRAGYYPMPEPSPASARLRRTALEVRGLPWHCPDPRSVTPVGEFRVNASLRRTLRHSGWATSMDTAFDQVLDRCTRPDADNFWLTARHRRTWRELHRRGEAHSVEVWDGEELVGGLFLVQTGGVVFVASLFHTRSNAAKVADLDLNRRLQEAGGALVDAGGFWYDYFTSVGVRRVPRSEYLATLRRTRDDAVPLSVDRLSAARLLEA